jgi:RHH-type proline utilization regulon transcriptional repressor/proline dehydrogenase/delta 1-pyrroline-5-carboxylate dehydrogenase
MLSSSLHTDSIEAAVTATAARILKRAQGRRSAPERWLRLLFQRLVANETFRVQALRFVDVFPALRDDDELLRHLREYFGDEGFPLPGVVRWGLGGGAAGHRAVAKAVRAAMHALAGRFVGGENAAQALATVAALHRRGLGFTLDCLGEASLSEAESDAYRDRYLGLLHDLGPAVRGWTGDPLVDGSADDPQPRLHLSVKVSALYSQADPVDTEGGIRAIAERLRPILLAARRNAAAVCLDMEQYERKGLVLGVFKRLLMEPELRDWPHASVAIQAYLRDATEDLQGLLDWTRARGRRISIRLVRGAYWDYETVVAQQRGWPLPVWAHKAQTDRSYERCMAWLMGNSRWLRPMIATHNLRSTALAMALAEQRSLPPGTVEFQVLYGMGEELAAGIRDEGHRVRVYVPFGEPIPGMAYLVRRLLENSASQELRRLDLDVSRPLAELVAPPEEIPDVPPPTPAGFRNQPLRRFHIAPERQAFARALEQVAGSLGAHYPLILDGHEVATRDEIVSTNPADPSEVVGVVAAAGEEEADRAVQGAARAGAQWHALGFDKRADLLCSCADALAEQRDLFAALQVLEAGKSWREADADVVEAIDFLRFYAHAARRLGVERAWPVPGEDNRMGCRPRGVAVVIPPWNFPLAITVGMTGAALVTGNTVLLKPSSRTPVIAARWVELMHRCGLPPGVLQLLPGAGEKLGEYLVTHPGVHLIAFTGSLAVGSRILRLAAARPAGQHHFKQVLAEMGGKNAIIVDADADLDEAVAGVVRSAFGFQGQKCSACSRVILVGGAREPFLQRLLAATDSLRSGPPREPGSFLGPVIDAVAAQRIRGFVERARGVCRVLYERNTAEPGGNFVGPVILDRVPTTGEPAREEIFGPVLSVFAVDDFEQALSLANDSAYALTGGVYSRSPRHLRRAREAFAVGNLYFNRAITGALVGRQPFGGFRLSGQGDKAGGADYLRRFLLPVTVTENTLRRGFAPVTDAAPREP